MTPTNTPDNDIEARRLGLVELAARAADQQQRREQRRLVEGGWVPEPEPVPDSFNRETWLLGDTDR